MASEESSNKQTNQVICKNREIQPDKTTTDSSLEKLLCASYIGGCRCIEYIDRPGSGETITIKRTDFKATCFNDLSFNDIYEARACMRDAFERAGQGNFRRHIIHECNPNCPWFCHRGLYICCMSDKPHFCSGYHPNSECAIFDKGVIICKFTARVIGEAYKTAWSQDHSKIAGEMGTQFGDETSASTDGDVPDQINDNENINIKQDYLEVKKPKALTLRERITKKIEQIRSKPITTSSILMLTNQHYKASDTILKVEGISMQDKELLLLDTSKGMNANDVSSILMLHAPASADIVKPSTDHEQYHKAIRNELKLTHQDRLNVIRKTLNKVCTLFTQAETEKIVIEIFELWEKIILTDEWRKTTGLYTSHDHAIASIYCMSYGGFRYRGVTLISKMDSELALKCLPPIKNLKTLESMSQNLEGITLYQNRVKIERELKRFISSWFYSQDQTQTSHPSSSSSISIEIQSIEKSIPCMNMKGVKRTRDESWPKPSPEQLEIMKKPRL